MKPLRHRRVQGKLIDAALHGHEGFSVSRVSYRLSAPDLTTSSNMETRQCILPDQGVPSAT